MAYSKSILKFLSLAVACDHWNRPKQRPCTLFAEDVLENSAVSPLMGRLVALDAFSQALTNPLLVENIFNEQPFSPVRFDIIKTTQSLSEVLHCNIPRPDRPFKVTLTQAG